ncbi:MAG: hypothetical protein KC910_16860 [Candidatus Eremiobacteraeota bacterium]|nr:hypothetical protein [Candidatus Eremiobacteraeota bacterium]
MDFQAALDRIKEGVQNGVDAVRDYADNNPDTVRKVGPIATGLLIFVGALMIFRAYREVPREADAGRGHPLAAVQEYDAEPAAQPLPEATAERGHPLAAEETGPAPVEPAAEEAYEAAPEQPAYQPAAAPVAAPSDAVDDSANDAGVALARFFHNLDEHNYGEAYRGLSSEWQASLPYERFAYGYGATEALNCEVEHVRRYEDGRVRVAVTLDAIENGQRSRYVASFLMVSEGGEWRLDRGLQLRI